MSLAIGYSGQPSLNADFSHNPLKSIVPNNLYAAVSEINAAVSALNYPPWRILNASQRKAVVAHLLTTRGDNLSLAQAQQVLIANPAFASIQIIPD